MMPDFMGHHISLGELAGRAETASQFTEKIQVQIDLLILRTVEGSGGRLGGAAAGIRVIAEKHQLRMTVAGAPLLRKDAIPSLLRVVEHERNELLLAIGTGVAVGLAGDLPGGSRSRRSAGKNGKQVHL